MCRLNPKVDFAFKKLFGSEENKDILMSFINSMMDEDKQIRYLELKNPYNLASYQKGKMSILDIKAQDQNDTWYDIEMQMAEQSYYDKRALYYWAKVYSDQIESGYDFEKLKKTISINILDFNYLKEEGYHNIYDIYNRDTKNPFSEIFEMHFIELNKFNKDFKEIKSTLDRWTAFLSKAYELNSDTIPEELKKDELVKKAIEKLEIMSLNKEEREIYQNELKRLMVTKAEITTAERKGELKGELKGKVEGLITYLELRFGGDISNVKSEIIKVMDIGLINELSKEIYKANSIEDVKSAVKYIVR
jgi:predicted transposase/invertase (TIGR01784 family)